MQPHPVIQKINSAFETAIIVIMQIVLMVVIAVAVFELVKLLYLGIRDGLLGVETEALEVVTVADLQRILQRSFGGVLLVLLGLELLDTLKTDFDEHRIRLEIILIVAIIAIGRHIILLDFEHLQGSSLVGIGVLVAALTGGYFVIKKLSIERRARSSRLSDEASQ